MEVKIQIKFQRKYGHQWLVYVLDANFTVR